MNKTSNQLVFFFSKRSENENIIHITKFLKIFNQLLHYFFLKFFLYARLQITNKKLIKN